MKTNQVTIQRIVNTLSFIILGLALGIGLCKFCKPFFMWAIGGIS